MDKVYLKSRYDKGEAAYLNCPMTEEEFNRFYDAVLEAEVAPVNEFEKENILKGVCLLKSWLKEGENFVIWSDETCWT